MKYNSIRISTLLFGSYVGLLSFIHGIFEILQGNVSTNGIFIEAIGPPCQTDSTWHACLPAITIIPNFLATGIVTIILSSLFILWLWIFGMKDYSGWVMIGLSITLLLVGGGFIAPLFYGITTSLTATRVVAPLNFWKNKVNKRILKFFGKSWIWLLIVYLLWFGFQWIFNFFLYEKVPILGTVILILELLLLLLTLITSIGHKAYYESINETTKN